MAGTICPTNCGAFPTITNYADICAPVRRKSGGSFLLFTFCDIADFTNPVDAAEWEAAKLALKAFLTPCGTWTMGAPTQDLVVVNGCGTKENQNSVITIDYTTPEHALDGTDTAMFKLLEKNQNLLRVIPITCQDRAFISDELFDDLAAGGTGAGIEVGIPFTFNITPYQDRPGDSKTFAYWKFQIEINKIGVYGDWDFDGVLAAVQNA